MRKRRSECLARCNTIHKLCITICVLYYTNCIHNYTKQITNKFYDFFLSVLIPSVYRKIKAKFERK